MKLTPAAINSLHAAAQPQPIDVDVAQIKENLREEVTREVGAQIADSVRVELEEEYYQKLSQIAQLREEEKAREAEERATIEASYEASGELIQQNRELADKLELAVQQANLTAQEQITQSAEALAAQRRELVELQQRENERLLETTTPIFNARKETKPICPDIEAQLISCYSENKDRSLLCAEIVRQYRGCLDSEKQA